MNVGTAGIVIGAIAVIGIGTNVVALSQRDTVVATVTDKERVQNCDSDGCTSKYLIFTDAETFENTDNLFVGKFNSSDVYGAIAEGETYKFDVYGFRVPFLSMYRNIVSATPVE